jgi:hypothetical protein
MIALLNWMLPGFCVVTSESKWATLSKMEGKE